MVVGQAHHLHPGVDQHLHRRGASAKVEVLGNWRAALGERALEVDHHQVRTGEERLDLEEAVAVHLRPAQSLGPEPVHPFLVVVAQRHVAAGDEGDRSWRGRRLGCRLLRRYLGWGKHRRRCGDHTRSARRSDGERADEDGATHEGRQRPATGV